MIIQEIVNINNRQLRHTYSSEAKYIKQVETDVVYDEAYDVLSRYFTYIETDTPIGQDLEKNFN